MQKIINMVAAYERQRWRELWEIGDRLNALEPTHADLVRLIAEVEEAGGNTHTTADLKRFMRTAAAYPKDTRRADVSFEVHAILGDPKVLAEIATPGRFVSREEARMVARHVKRFPPD